MDKKTERIMAVYNERKAQNKCTGCGGTPRPGKLQCAKCGKLSSLRASKCRPSPRRRQYNKSLYTSSVALRDYIDTEYNIMDLLDVVYDMFQRVIRMDKGVDAELEAKGNIEAKILLVELLHFIHHCDTEDDDPRSLVYNEVCDFIIKLDEFYYS